MAVPATGTDITAVYTTQALVERYLPANSITATGISSAPGKVTPTDLSDLIREMSRKFDAVGNRIGLQVPFPAATVMNPRTPDYCRAQVTHAVVGEVRSILAFGGNRKTGAAKQYIEQAADEMQALIDDPNLIGFEDVTTPEVLTHNATVDQFGKIISNLYRFANRNVIADTIVFCNAAGDEVFRGDGWPFSRSFADWGCESQAEGIFWLYNEAAILQAVGASGGVKYRFSWRKLDWGQSHDSPFKGVSRI